MKPWGVALVTVLVAGGMVGGGTYYYMNKKAISDKDSLQRQINDLNSKYKTVQANLNTVQNSATYNTNSTQTATATTKKYTNPTYGWSMIVPTGWVANQARVLDADSNIPSILDATITFTSASSPVLTINMTAKTKAGNQTVSQFADGMYTYSGRVNYTIGSLSGIKQITDYPTDAPAISLDAGKVVEYYAADNSYFYTMTTYSPTESTDVVAALKTFAVK